MQILSKSVDLLFLNINTFTPHYNTSMFLNATQIRSIPYQRRHQHFEEKEVILKNHFLPISRKRTKFRVKGRLFQIILKEIVSVHIFVQINNSRKGTFFWHHFQKSFFFSHISENINISMKRIRISHMIASLFATSLTIYTIIRQ